MGHLRSCQAINFKNYNFLGVLLALPFNYALLFYEYLMVEGYFSPWFYIITVFYLMSFWSFLAVVFVDPGSVPKYWGLMSQKMQGERKYCLVCHNFKPERCHHCSKCGKCVLNMDHHCPWINNCVGFQNRKYFLLFLIYMIATLTVSLVLMTMVLVKQISDMSAGRKRLDLHTIIRLVLFVVFLFLEITLMFFTYTHIKYVLVNTTTLEQMVIERKRRTGDYKTDQFCEIYEDSEYNLSKEYNFTQVFGQNAMYWFVPLQDETPLSGKGLYWQKRIQANTKQPSMLNTVHFKSDI